MGLENWCDLVQRTIEDGNIALLDHLPDAIA
jgi:hypothetical protein